MITHQWLPDDFAVPDVLETDRFRLRMLSINDVVKDYDAVMSSVEHLQGAFGPGDDWPRGLTFEQDLADLGWHQLEFQLRSSFAYTVMSPDESICLGCAYIYRSSKRSYDAEVYIWVRESEYPNGFDAKLYEVVTAWITDVWPMQRVAYPIRDIPWAEWEQLPDAEWCRA